jgi:hypothetical protein
LVYVGKDMSLSQGRVRQHLASIKQIITNFQLVDIYLASKPEEDITFEYIPTRYDETARIEAEMI